MGRLCQFQAEKGLFQWKIPEGNVGSYASLHLSSLQAVPKGCGTTTKDLSPHSLEILSDGRAKSSATVIPRNRWVFPFHLTSGSNDPSPQDFRRQSFYHANPTIFPFDLSQAYRGTLGSSRWSSALRPGPVHMKTTGSQRQIKAMGELQVPTIPLDSAEAMKQSQRLGRARFRSRGAAGAVEPQPTKDTGALARATIHPGGSISTHVEQPVQLGRARFRQASNRPAGTITSQSTADTIAMGVDTLHPGVSINTDLEREPGRARLRTTSAGPAGVPTPQTEELISPLSLYEFHPGFSATIDVKQTGRLGRGRVRGAPHTPGLSSLHKITDKSNPNLINSHPAVFLTTQLQQPRHPESDGFRASDGIAYRAGDFSLQSPADTIISPSTRIHAGSLANTHQEPSVSLTMLRDPVRLKFNHEIFASPLLTAKTEDNTKKIESLMDKLAVGELVMNEGIFLDEHVRFQHHPKALTSDELTPHQRKSFLNEERNRSLQTGVNILLKHKQLWLQHWSKRSEFKFASHYQKIELLGDSRVGEMVITYLFYVEMISTIVPSPVEEHTIGWQQEEAFKLLENIFRRGPPRLTAIDPILQDKGIKVQNSLKTGGTVHFFSALWTLLELWLENYRPELMERMSQTTPNNEKLRSLKVFFNTIFCHSIQNLSRRIGI
ncbi:hypothetical protein MJO28_017560 [Puccinia striiformis f. sp. tritici]|nr:hypothetical protein MJO28_017560 [Puccinia striiformis f. sp. tritici]